jgi:hypothetical protein
MALTHGDYNCDSCGTWCDLDPVALLGRTPELYGLEDPAKVQELIYFWLCGDCSPDYPNGAKDFFTEDYFEIEEPYCSSCEIEPVLAWGNSCGSCDY